MTRNSGPWHYEYYPTNPDDGKPWRIGDDAHDDYVMRVALESEAIRIVRDHNSRTSSNRPDSWKS